MFLKPNRKQQATVLIDNAMRKRTLAQELLDQAEADLAKAKQLMTEREEDKGSVTK